MWPFKHDRREYPRSEQMNADLESGGIVYCCVREAMRKEKCEELNSGVSISPKECKTLSPLWRELGVECTYVALEPFETSKREIYGVCPLLTNSVSLGNLTWRPLDLIVLAYTERKRAMLSLEESYKEIWHRPSLEFKRATDARLSTSPNLLGTVAPSLITQIFIELSVCYLSRDRKGRAELLRRVHEIVEPGGSDEERFVSRFIVLSLEDKALRAQKETVDEVRERIGEVLPNAIALLLGSRADTKSPRAKAVREALEAFLTETRLENWPWSSGSIEYDESR